MEYFNCYAVTVTLLVKRSVVQTYCRHEEDLIAVEAVWLLCNAFMLCT
jgi:hypothetical protein